MFRTHVNLKTAAKHIRDGDLLLFRRRGIIAAFGRSEYSHAAKAAWWGDELFCLEVREWCGGRAVTLASQVKKHPSAIDVFRPGARWPQYDAAEATRYLKNLAGSDYGYAAVLLAALRHLPFVRLFVRPLDDADAELRPPFCSQACRAGRPHRRRSRSRAAPRRPLNRARRFGPQSLLRIPVHVSWRIVMNRFVLALAFVGCHCPACPAVEMFGCHCLACPAVGTGYTLPTAGRASSATQVLSATLAQCPGGVCPAPSSPAPKVAPLPAVVRIANAGTSGATLGSGALVATRNGQSYILTCHHLFRDGVGRISVTFPQGTSRSAEIGAADPANDLVLLVIEAVAIKPLELDLERIPSGTLAACGYGSTGEFAAARGPVRGWSAATGSRAPSLVIGAQVRQGDSGGPVINSYGQVVAVIWGACYGESYATAGRPLRLFIEQNLPKPIVNEKPSVPLVPRLPEETAPKEVTPKVDVLEPWRNTVTSELQKLREQLTELTPRSETQALNERLKQLASNAAKTSPTWLPWLLTGLGVSSPVGAAIVLGCWLLKRRFTSTTSRGVGGPRTEPFRDAAQNVTA